MTRHRAKEEWISEILDAASDEILESGYPNLTMEAIAARTSLSKGGVYRFFANKTEIALALFTMCYTRSLDFELEEAVRWNQPIDVTISRLITRLHANPDEMGRFESIWVQLAPEAMRDERFRAERHRLLGLLQDKFGRLVHRLCERDGIALSPDFDQTLENSLLLGIALLEGLIFQGATGLSIDKQIELVSAFVTLTVQHTLGGAQ